MAGAMMAVSGEADAPDDALLSALRGLVLELRTEADKRVNDRLPIEGQWIEDLLNYHAKYDAQTLSLFEPGKDLDGRAKVFIGKTREKSNGMTSRLFNVLFPTDDKNWSIAPTPVPELTEASEQSTKRIDDLQAQQANPVQPNPEPGEMQEAQDEADRIEDIMEAARGKARLMSREIEDQLEECRYPAQCRDAIEDAVKIGTGLMLGPLANERAKRQWAEVPVLDDNGQPVLGDDGQPTTTFELQHGEDKRPAAWRLDPWNCFPSSDARGVEDSEGFYIRHIWTAKQVRAFANIPDVDADAVRHILRANPVDSAPEYLTKLRSIGAASESVAGARKFYTVWQYIGPLTAGQMECLARAFGDKETAAEMGGEVDPLQEVQAIVWFCGDTPLKFSIYPLDSGEPLVNAFRFEKEEGSFWGYGIPRIMRDDQSILNAMWRMMIDNADLASGGMIYIDRDTIRAVDNSKRLYGRKIFEKMPGKQIDDWRRAIGHIDIPIRQAELLNIINLASQNIDEATHQPNMGGDGERVPMVTNTAQGTALWLNTFNVMLVRVLKNYDDDMTVPMIRKFFDWNMQFSKKREIKGDMEVSARGSSVLLVRAQQAQSILGLALAFGGHPIFGPYIKEGDTVREVYRAHNLDPGEFVRTDSEAQQIIQQQADAQQPAGPDPAIEQAKLDLESERIEAEMANAEADRAVKLEIAQLEYDRVMAMAAAQMNVQQDKLEADIAAKREALQQKERSIAVEAALRAEPAAPLNQTQIANT